MGGTELMIRLVFRSASLELLLVAISQNGPMFGWAPPRGRFALENGGGGPVGPVREASKALILPPTWQGLPAGLEVVHGYEVSRQVKDGPPQSHGPVLSPDVSGDGVKGSEAQQSGQKQPDGIQRLPASGISPETGQRPAQVILRDLQEAHGMPSRDTWGGALVRRRPPHPRRQLALEGKGKAGHTLHLPLPGSPPAARRE
eukprot:XP_025002324.1 uncharacterized protein LOC112531452 isoform X2 [Gallus gallus]